jgi:AhpC/TSA antioxidant enzyme
LRRSYPDITQRGADVVVIGTGNVAYAKAFVADEQIPFLVLVDDDARAARAAAVRKVNFVSLMGPKSWAATRRAWRDGFRIHKSGKRVNQLGATFVVGPGPTVSYEHHDGDSADHAPVEAVLEALPVG